MKKITATSIGMSNNKFTRLNQKSKYTLPKSKIIVTNLDTNRSITQAPMINIAALRGQQQQQVSSLDVGSWH